MEIGIVVTLMIFCLSRFATFAVKRVADMEDAQFVLMLRIVSVAGLIAESINLPDIVGAFLAGLSINAAFKASSGKKKIEFLANSLFIPIFFVVTGFVIDPAAFLQSITAKAPLAASVVGALPLGKWIAAEVVGRSNGYSRTARMTVWSLTLPQVAATLAAALVAFKTLDPAGKQLVDAQLLNVVFVLMIFTAILGPVLTDRLAPRMLEEEKLAEEQNRGLKRAS